MSNGRDYTAMAPARRAGQNNGCEAAATVVLENHERRMPSGGLRDDRRQEESPPEPQRMLNSMVLEWHQAAVMVVASTRAGSYLEVSSTSLKLSRRLTLVEYAWKIAGKYVYKLIVY